MEEHVVSHKTVLQKIVDTKFSDPVLFMLADGCTDLSRSKVSEGNVWVSGANSPSHDKYSVCRVI